MKKEHWSVTCQVCNHKEKGVQIKKMWKIVPGLESEGWVQRDGGWDCPGCATVPAEKMLENMEPPFDAKTRNEARKRMKDAYEKNKGESDARSDMGGDGGNMGSGVDATATEHDQPDPGPDKPSDGPEVSEAPGPDGGRKTIPARRGSGSTKSGGSDKGKRSGSGATPPPPKSSKEEG